MLFRSQVKDLTKKPERDFVIAQLENALADFEVASGVKGAIQSIRYDEGFANIRIKVSVIGDDGEVFSEEAEAFNKYAVLFDLQSDWLGKTFKSTRGREFKITGLKPGNRKYPVIATALDDGKSYKFPAASVRDLMGGPKQVALKEDPPEKGGRQ